MKVLALLGSPKKEGHTSTLVQEMLDGAKKNGHQTDLIYLADLNIKDCVGCMACQKKEICVIRDDIQKVEDAIKNNDLIIFSSPTHWGNISAILLRTMERLFGFLIKERPFAAPLALNAKGKKAILVTACSTPAPIDWLFNQSRATMGRLKEICSYSGMKIVATLVLPGTSRIKTIPEKYIEKARKLGQSI